MVKFARKAVRPQVTAPIKTMGRVAKTRTYEGARAFGRDAKSELFLLAVTDMVAERTFYESDSTRDDRFADLVAKVTAEDPDWVARFVPWLRNTAHMRSAAVVMAAEYVKAGGPNGRSVVASAMSRADEPAEMLAYWAAMHGKRFPQPVKRGVADAVGRLYTERAALKYDGLSRAWRMGDVVDLVHPKPRNEVQSDLFRYLLDRRHHPDGMTVSPKLTLVAARAELEAVPAEDRRAMLNSDSLRAAGANWEWLSGWLPGGMDAEAWEAMIPSMGYMALLRNLRNFDEADVGEAAVAFVAAKLGDPAEVAASRQFPFRFWSAYRNVPSVRWAPVLERALDLSTANVPELPGRTLVLTDTSGSMQGPVSGRSMVRHFEVAGLFAAATAKRSANVDLVSFASSWERIPFKASASVLRTVETIEGRIGRVGHGTELGKALRGAYRKHDRVVVFSDMQTADWVPELPGAVVYLFNTGGYRATPFQVGGKGRYELGGFSDATFRLMAMLEDLEDADWPF